MQPQLTWNFCSPCFRLLSTQITDGHCYMRLNGLLVTLLPPIPSFDPCTEGTSNDTLVVACLTCSFCFALAGASQLMLLPSGMYLPQASVASARPQASALGAFSSQQLRKSNTQSLSLSREYITQAGGIRIAQRTLWLLFPPPGGSRAPPTYVTWGSL